ncbi:MAG: tRNA (adenosine(37)-N6)-threonylcarbamoyltransferase complex dimerization subunit type 1 TsaB [Tannerellaceae bacterium]|jgi:tRNA threonylcarbamoyladenosine biosynthesis protein TsaB|nr:tRNA (adenosine(37)-N6)-threonylcarbamoyltransferase complex dimerization subunit type 1 TsaB [Tannerellaceae bacterium]
MPLILHIETSTSICSAAISSDGTIICEKMSTDSLSHAGNAGIFVEEIIDNLNGNRLDAVAVSSGPGSYTGLRIGASLAKGLCFGYNIPLIAVSTLRLLALQAAAIIGSRDNSLICPMIDARRMEVYASVYDFSLVEISPVHAEIITPSSYESLLSDRQIYFCGNGASKCREMIVHPNAVFVDNIYPSAKDMTLLAEAAWAAGQFEDTAYFEPLYLKEWGQK